MDAKRLRQQRLGQLLDLARAYRRISRRKLASLLDRDPGRIIPESGVPKLDLVVRLAGQLDWPVEQVIRFLELEDDALPTDGDGQSFESLQKASREAWSAGQYTRAAALAQCAYSAARSADDRALASNREVAAWNGLGHYSRAVDAVRKGLRETTASLELRLILESNLANAYYTGWELLEARSIARDLLDWYEEHPPESQRDRATQAFAFYVHGNTLRRMIITDGEGTRKRLQRARSDLETSDRLYVELADEYQDESYAGIANTCRGGIIEVEVELAHRTPDDALRELLQRLDAIVDLSNCLNGEWLESYGWLCIFGCNIALRHLSDERVIQRYMGVFTNKADEIAQRIDSWPLWERVFSMEYARCERICDLTGMWLPPPLDEDDVHVIVGTMGRYPAFRDRGLRLLQSARIVRNE